MSKNLPKYNLKQATVKVGYPNGFNRYDPRSGKYVHVKPHTRKQMVRDYTYSNKILEHQKIEKDWGHLSGEYPNLLGLSDEEINQFIKEYKFGTPEITKEYIKHIKCYDKDDIRHYSKRAFKKFEKTMIDKNYTKMPEGDGKDPYSKDYTIFITSPRGGFNILGDFAYANKLEKKNLPYDIDKLKFTTDPTLTSDALPYGQSISDVNDIVFIDDIYMSGDQCRNASSVLKNKISQLDIPTKQQPRLHYLAIAGNKTEYHDSDIDKWDSFTVGDELDFRRDGKKFEGVSAVIFPFSIPDGDRHKIGRRLYSKKKRFEHRKFE